MILHQQLAWSREDPCLVDFIRKGAKLFHVALRDPNRRLLRNVDEASRTVSALALRWGTELARQIVPTFPSAFPGTRKGKFVCVLAHGRA